ncbi:transcriptional regulator [Maricaulis maris]|uniref:transcriptional regulator n=1 Tax=Maricaulis maris TaxID=74318 RepID=UPI003A9068CA
MSDARKPLLETHPHLKDFLEFLDDFNKETDRGAALAAAAMVDDLLSRTIEAFLIPNKGSKALLSGFNAPLSSFSARIAGAYAMGLISEQEHREASLIRKVRNEFAHEVKVSFATKKIIGLCRELAMAAKSYDDVKVDTRGQFTTAAVALILNLTNRPHYAKCEGLMPRVWQY